MILASPYNPGDPDFVGPPEWAAGPAAGSDFSWRDGVDLAERSVRLGLEAYRTINQPDRSGGSAAVQGGSGVDPAVLAYLGSRGQQSQASTTTPDWVPWVVGGVGVLALGGIAVAIARR